MGKKKADDPQREKFEALVKKMEADGELNPTEADEALDRLVKRSSNVPKKSTGG